jgi:amidase
MADHPTMPELQAAMDARRLSAAELTGDCIARIERLDRGGPKLNSVLEINPDAPAIAAELDAERTQSGPRGPLHGIPVLLKDNIATADRMHTSAGSLALADSIAPEDAFLAARLRAAGAVLLGKANMTEWANYMTTLMPAGYSSRGGQVVNPYDARLSPGGSSSGSAVAVAAGLAPVAVGTETSGSILFPANQNALVGLKPTVGLISRHGIIPISATQDTAGPLATSVIDAAILLGAMTGMDPRDRATTRINRGREPLDHYHEVLGPGDLKGVRIGVPRIVYFDGLSPAELRLIDASLVTLRELGAGLVDPADIATARQTAEFRSDVMLYDFKRDLNKYLAWLGPKAPVRNLKDLIKYNESRPREMLRHGQVMLLAAQSSSGTRSPVYKHCRAEDVRLSRTDGIDPVLKQHKLDALVFPLRSGAAIGARAGYPTIIVPAGFTPDGAPVGLSFLGPAWSEAKLLRLAHAYEQATKHRRPPAWAM